MVFQLPLLPLTKPRTMRFLIFVLLLVLLSSSVISQHPWMIPIGNATDDMLYTLRIQPGDSVCVELETAHNLASADSIEAAISSTLCFSN